MVPFKVIADSNGNAVFEVQGKMVTPEEVGAQILIKMKETAEAYLGEKVTEAVIQFLPTSTTPSVNPPKMPAALQASMSNVSSLNLQQRH